MSKKAKTIIAVAAVLTLMLMFAACSKNEESNNDIPKGEPVDEELINNIRDSEDSILIRIGGNPDKKSFDVYILDNEMYVIAFGGKPGEYYLIENRALQEKEKNVCADLVKALKEFDGEKYNVYATDTETVAVSYKDIEIHYLYQEVSNSELCSLLRTVLSNCNYIVKEYGSLPQYHEKGWYYKHLLEQIGEE